MSRDGQQPLTLQITLLQCHPGLASAAASTMRVPFAAAVVRPRADEASSKPLSHGRGLNMDSDWIPRGSNSNTILEFSLKPYVVCFLGHNSILYIGTKTEPSLTGAGRRHSLPFITKVLQSAGLKVRTLVFGAS